MKFIACAFLSLFFISTIHAQELSNQLYSVAGQSSKTNQIQLDWSLGEISTTTEYAGGVMYTQGFHQPVIFRKKYDDQKITSASSVNIWPNPTQNYLTVGYSGKETNDLSFELYNMHGEVMKNIEVTSQQSVFTLNISRLMPGVYYLRVHNASGMIVDFQKVIKTI